MSLTANLYDDAQATLDTTCTQIVFGPSVDVAWFSANGDCYLIYSDALDDGDARPSDRGFPIPSGTLWPIRNCGKKAFVAAASGAPLCGVLGEAG